MGNSSSSQYQKLGLLQELQVTSSIFHLKTEKNGESFWILDLTNSKKCRFINCADKTVDLYMDEITNDPGRLDLMQRWDAGGTDFALVILSDQTKDDSYTALFYTGSRYCNKFELKKKYMLVPV